jgi:hypothetical protein
MPKSIYIAGPYSGSCEALRPVPKRIYIESQQPSGGYLIQATQQSKGKLYRVRASYIDDSGAPARP